ENERRFTLLESPAHDVVIVADESRKAGPDPFTVQFVHLAAHIGIALPTIDRVDAGNEDARRDLHRGRPYPREYCGAMRLAAAEIRRGRCRRTTWRWHGRPLTLSTAATSRRCSTPSAPMSSGRPWKVSLESARCTAGGTRSASGSS